MRGNWSIAGALVTVLALTGCSDTPLNNNATSPSAGATRPADRADEQRREHDEQVAQLDERAMKLEHDYQERVPAEPRGTAGGTAPNARRELSEDITTVKNAVAYLRTTTPENWWQRHEEALKQTADDVEADVKRVAGNLPAPDRAKEAPAAADGTSTAPFNSARDRLVNVMGARIDSWNKALENAQVPRARQPEIDDLKARVKKLAEDVDELKSASADDWWDVSRQRVADYIERVEGSVARLDTRGPDGRGPDARGRDSRDAGDGVQATPRQGTTREEGQR